MNKLRAGEIIGSSELPSFDNRFILFRLMHRYVECMNALAVGDINEEQYKKYQNMTKQEMKEVLKSDKIYGVVATAMCCILEAGEHNLLRDGLDFEPDQIDIEDEDDCCEICGNSREGFTENLCEECFDNEIDDYYDGGRDEYED